MSGRIHSAVFWLHPTFPSQSVMTGSKYPLPHPTLFNQRPFHLLSFPRSESQVTVYPSHPFAHAQIFKCFPRTGPGVGYVLEWNVVGPVPFCAGGTYLPVGWVGSKELMSPGALPVCVVKERRAQYRMLREGSCPTLENQGQSPWAEESWRVNGIN